MNKTRIAAMLCALMTLFGLSAASYGLPSKIEQGNILHCFNWSIAQVRSNLTAIAEAGYGSVQLSPLQRGDVNQSETWHTLYRPYDLAFKASPFMGSEADLKALCNEAHALGIKVIVDVVANHVDKTAGYHDTWWDSNGRVRWNGGINYGDRYSITHGQLGDYGDINSESSEVQDRAKAYVQWLKNAGVDGIRWDAAKHIALPSEGCGFWTAVTSVPGMWHYGEILDAPGPNASVIKEYANYMAVTDNKYSNGAAKENGGIPYGFGGSWVVDHQLSDSKVVYWGESHDTYSNDEWSQNVDQSVIDRAYASVACRNGAIALYLARPNAKGSDNIKLGKGTDAFKSKAVAEVNKFRNAMVGKADYFTNNGNAISVTRQNGGAVVVTKGSGNVSIANGGGYAKPGTYTDKVSGNKFTVTSSTISGNVGNSGIAVLYDDSTDPTPDPDPTTSVTITGDYNLCYSGDKASVYYWGGSSKPEWPGVEMTTVTGSDGKSYKCAKVAEGTTQVIFNTNGDSNKTGDLTYSGTYVMNDNGATSTPVTFKNGTTPDPDPDPDPETKMWILGNLATGGWGSTPGAGVAMTANGSVYTAKGVEFVKVGENDGCYFNLTDYVGATWDELNMKANRYGADEEGVTLTSGKTASIVKYTNNVNASACKSWIVAPGTYDITADLSTMKITIVKTGDDPDPDPDPETLTITGDYNLCYSGDKANVYYWGGSSKPEWPGVEMTTVTGSDGKSYKCAKVAEGTKQVVFNTNGDSNKTGDLDYSGAFVMNDNGATTTAVVFKNGGTPDPEAFTIYYDNSKTNWSGVNIHYWDSPKTEWPGVAMTLVKDNIYSYTFASSVNPATITGFLFCATNPSGDAAQTANMNQAPVNGHLYQGAGGNKGAVTDLGEYKENDDPTPDPETLTITGDYNLCYSGDKANVYFWGGSSKPEWPGVEMTTVTGSDGKSYKCAKVAEGTKQVVFNTNGDSNKTGDLDYSGAFVMNDNGATTTAVVFKNGGTPDPDPNGDVPAKLYIIGTLNEWNPATPIEMTKISETKFQLADVKMTADAEGEYSYFSFCSQTGTSWDGTGNNDGVNDGNRFGPAEKDELISTAKNASFVVYKAGVNASACNSYKVVAGKYAVTVDFANNTVTLGLDVSVDSIDADKAAEKEYYTLQGVRVAEPQEGIYIVRQGNKVWKEVIK